MALMTYREANQVLWRGVRPAHDGTQITKAMAQTGAGEANIYAGHATKKLFITYLMLSSREDIAAAGTAYIKTIPIGEGAAVRLMDHRYDVAGHQCSASNLAFPIEVAANQAVIIGSTNANIDAHGIIHGWIE